MYGDVFNINLSNSTGGTNAFGTVTAADISIININTVDTGTTTGTVATTDALVLTADAATTINVSGNNGINLTATGSDAVTTFDASGIVADAAEDTATLLAVTYTSLNTTATATVSITGGDGNDTLSGAVAIDTISGGLGNDTIQGGAGADVLDGGAGTADVLTYADVTAADDHALAGVTGMAINLSAAAVTAATVSTAMGGTVVVGGGDGVAGADLAAGTAGYLTTNAASSLETMVRDTVSNFETVIGSGLDDFIVGSATADVINGGAGNDTIVLTETAAAIDTLIRNGDGSTDGSDTVTGFVVGTGGDTIDLTTSGVTDTDDDSEVADDALGIVTAAGETLISGMNIINVTDFTGTLDAAGLAAELATDGVKAFNDGNMAAYLAIDNGTDTAIFEFVDSDDNTVVDADELTLMVTLTGVSDATTLTGANFIDFA